METVYFLQNVGIFVCVQDDMIIRVYEQDQWIDADIHFKWYRDDARVAFGLEAAVLC